MHATLRLPLLPPGGPIERGKATVTEPTEIIVHDATDTHKGTIADMVRQILVMIGEAPNRGGLRKTPERYEKVLRFLTGGYNQNVDSVQNGATFSVHCEMVVI